MDLDKCWERLRQSRHAILATTADDGGINLVPICYVVVDESIFMPVDRVKPKATLQLRRLDDLRQRPRAALIVEHYDDDWTQLWWVKLSVDVNLDMASDEVESTRIRLADRYPQYRPPDSVASVVKFDAVAISGWEWG
jgi:PPOX class probable F420-dependent enzyme